MRSKYPSLCTPGKDFLLRKHGHHLAGVNDIGSLGMREVSAVATLIHAEVSLVFEEHSAVTTLQLPYVKVRSSSELVESASIVGALDYSRIVFICCDDDKYPAHPRQYYLSDQCLVQGTTHNVQEDASDYSSKRRKLRSGRDASRSLISAGSRIAIASFNRTRPS